MKNDLLLIVFIVLILSVGNVDTKDINTDNITIAMQSKLIELDIMNPIKEVSAALSSIAETDTSSQKQDDLTSIHESSSKPSSNTKPDGSITPDQLDNHLNKKITLILVPTRSFQFENNPHYYYNANGTIFATLEKIELNEPYIIHGTILKSSTGKTFISAERINKNIEDNTSTAENDISVYLENLLDTDVSLILTPTDYFQVENNPYYYYNANGIIFATVEHIPLNQPWIVYGTVTKSTSSGTTFISAKGLFMPTFVRT
jgi:hypothetical protein